MRDFGSSKHPLVRVLYGIVPCYNTVLSSPLTVISSPERMIALPSDIKKAAIALVVSCISTLVAVYFDGLKNEELGYGDPFTLYLNIGWTLIIAWIVWELIRGKDIKLILILVGIVMLAGLVWEILEYGFGLSQVFYALELSMFVATYYFVSTKESKAWYNEKRL